MIQPGEMLPIGLAGTIYKAAGEPQRGYSCVLSSVVRCRAGKEEFEAVLENYKISMLGLTASSLRRERRRVPRLPAQEKSQDVHPIETKSK